MKSYDIFAVYKLKMWIAAEVLMKLMFLFGGCITVFIARISLEYRVLFSLPVDIAVVIFAAVIFFKDTKSYSLCKKAMKDKNAVLKTGTFVKAKKCGFYQTLEVEVDGEKIEVTPKIPSWSYNDYYRVHHDEVALMLSDGKHFLLEEK